MTEARLFRCQEADEDDVYRMPKVKVGPDRALRVCPHRHQILLLATAAKP